MTSSRRSYTGQGTGRRGRGRHPPAALRLEPQTKLRRSSPGHPPGRGAPPPTLTLPVAVDGPKHGDRLVPQERRIHLEDQDPVISRHASPLFVGSGPHLAAELCNCGHDHPMPLLHDLPGSLGARRGPRRMECGANLELQPHEIARQLVSPSPWEANARRYDRDPGLQRQPGSSLAARQHAEGVAVDRAFGEDPDGLSRGQQLLGLSQRKRT